MILNVHTWFFYLDYYLYFRRNLAQMATHRHFGPTVHSRLHSHHEGRSSHRAEDGRLRVHSNGRHSARSGLVRRSGAVWSRAVQRRKATYNQTVLVSGPRRRSAELHRIAIRADGGEILFVRSAEHVHHGESGLVSGASGAGQFRHIDEDKVWDKCTLAAERWDVVNL